MSAQTSCKNKLCSPYFSCTRVDTCGECCAVATKSPGVNRGLSLPDMRTMRRAVSQRPSRAVRSR